MSKTNNLFKYGIVIDVNDEYDGDRIRVHIKGIDPIDFKIKDIPYAFPMLPKQLYIKPKVGEVVFCIVQGDSYDDDRFFIGPIISQPHKLDYDTTTSLSFLNAGVTKPDIAPSTDPENTGVQLENDDIGLQGRGASEVVVKPDEVRLRAGKSNKMKKLNKKNPSYIQVKYNKVTDSGSVNIVSDNINLLSHNSKDSFNLTDSKNLINDNEYNKILEKAHQLPYGDLLVDLLNIIIKAIITHVHAYDGLPPDLDQIELKKLLEYKLDNILSKNIRIN